jgi:hypothetical protein
LVLIVRPDAEERERLERLAGTGKAAAYKIRHANILLAVDESKQGAKLSCWEDDRNNRSKRIDWQFKTSDARIKLRRLYPQIQMC